MTSVFEFLNKMATNEPRQKRSRTVVRYQMNLSFSSAEAKENFLTSLEKVKRILSRRSLRQLDNLELLQSLFDMVDNDLDDDSTVGNDSSSTTTTPCQRQTKLKYVYFLICLIKCIIIIIGIYTHASEDDSMFICEMKTLLRSVSWVDASLCVWLSPLGYV